MAYILGGRSRILILLHLNQLDLTSIGSEIHIFTRQVVTYVYYEMLKCKYFRILIRLAVGMSLLLCRCSSLKSQVGLISTAVVGIKCRGHDCECIFYVWLMIIDLSIYTKYLCGGCGWWESVWVSEEVIKVMAWSLVQMHTLF